MPSIRKNVKDLTQDEKQRYLAALKHLKETKRQLPSGKHAPVTIFEEYAVIHRSIMMLILKDGTKQPIGHNGASFVSWHRAYLKNFEEDLQNFDHTVSLIYWDWTDSDSTKALLSDDFLGASHPGPISGPLQGWKTALDNTLLTREPGDPEDLVNHTSGVYDLIKRDLEFEQFAKGLESFHNFVHVWSGGHMQNVGTAANDPIFYIHHTNVDRLFSLYQDFGHQKAFSTFYLKSGGYQESGNRVGSLLWPWDGGFAHVEADALRNAIAHRVVGGEKAITNGSVLDYRNMRVGYDVVAGKLQLGTPYNSPVAKFKSYAFNFEVQEDHSGNVFTFETSNTEVDVEMELYGPALCDNCYGDQRGYDDNSGSGGLNARIALTLKNGNYTAIVRPHNPTDQIDNGSSFTITVSATLSAGISQSQSPAAQQGKGTALTIGTNYRASISAHGEVDWYNFTITGNRPVPVSIESKGMLETVLVLYGANPPKGIIDWEDNSGESLSASLKKTLQPGLYHVALRTSSNQFGNYTIWIRA